MTDQEWFELVRDGADEGWKAVWERVVEPESRSGRSAGLMKKYSLARGDLMGMLYEDMIGRRKIDLYRGEGSFEGWLRRYVRGYILNADPNPHGEISIEGARTDEDGENRGENVVAGAAEDGERIRDRLAERAIREEHLARRPADDGRTDVHERREAVHDGAEQAAACDDDRDADEQHLRIRKEKDKKII